MVKCILSASLSLAILFCVPGLPFYEALGQVVQAPGTYAPARVVAAPSGVQPFQVPWSNLSDVIGGLGSFNLASLNASGLQTPALSIAGSQRFYRKHGPERAGKSSGSETPLLYKANQEKIPAATVSGRLKGTFQPRLKGSLSPLGRLGREWAGLKKELLILESPFAEPGSLFVLGRKIEGFLTRLGSREVLPPLTLASRALSNTPGTPRETRDTDSVSDRSPAKGPIPETAAGNSKVRQIKPPDEAVEKAYRSGKRAWNIKTAASFGAMAALVSWSVYNLLVNSGFAGLQSSLSLVGIILVVPIIRDLGRRLRRVTPKGLPKLDSAKYSKLYRMVSELSSKAGLKMPELLMWDTSAPNAAATGIETPVIVTKTYVLFSRGILKIMGPKELAGIVGHELSHIRHHDILLLVVRQVLGLVFILNLLGAMPSLPIFLSLVAVKELIGKYMSRAREYLADLGGAFLTGHPGTLAGALLGLDIWQRMVAGLNISPVGTFGFEELTKTHPPMLRRIEGLRRVADSRAPKKPSGMGSYKAWMLSLTGAFSFLVWPLMFYGFVKWGWHGLAILVPAIAAVWVLKKWMAKRGAGRDVVVKRFLAYLTHPDVNVRERTARWIFKMTGKTISVRILNDVNRAVKTALGQETNPELKTAFGKVQIRLESKALDLIKLSLRVDRIQDAKIRDAMRSALKAGKIHEDAEGFESAKALLSDVEEPDVLKGLAGPSTLETLEVVSLHFVKSKDHGPPYIWGESLALLSDSSGRKDSKLRLTAVGFDFTDYRTGEIFISEPLWRVLTPSARAGWLYREAARLRAIRAFESKGKIWAHANPEAQDIKTAVARLTPIPGSEFSIVRKEMNKLLRAYSKSVKSSRPKKVAWRKTPSKLLKVVYSGLIHAAEGIDSARNALSTVGFLSALAWGVGFGLFGIRLGAGVLTVGLTGFAAFYSYSKLRSLPWHGSKFPKTLAWFTPLAALTLASLWLASLGVSPFVGARSFSLLWIVVTWLQTYLLRNVLERKNLSTIEAVAAVFMTSAVAASALAGDPYTFLKALVMVGFYFHLARHGRRGGVVYAGSGAFLAGAAWGLFLAGFPGYAFLGTLVAAHFLGKRLTRGLEPVDKKHNGNT